MIKSLRIPSGIAQAFLYAGDREKYLPICSTNWNLSNSYYIEIIVQPFLCVSSNIVWQIILIKPLDIFNFIFLKLYFTFKRMTIVNDIDAGYFITIWISIVMFWAGIDI